MAVAAAVTATGGATEFVDFALGCDAVGDDLAAGEFGMLRFVDGGLALLAGICGGLSAPL